MMATIAWGGVVIRVRVDPLRLSPELKRVLSEQLIAGLYLVRVAAQARSPGKHAAITLVAEGLRAEARALDGPLAVPAGRATGRAGA
jgi:hypothetical protein